MSTPCNNLESLSIMSNPCNKTPKRKRNIEKAEAQTKKIKRDYTNHQKIKRAYTNHQISSPEQITAVNECNRLYFKRGTNKLCLERLPFLLLFFMFEISRSLFLKAKRVLKAQMPRRRLTFPTALSKCSPNTINVLKRWTSDLVHKKRLGMLKQLPISVMVALFEFNTQEMRLKEKVLMEESPYHVWLLYNEIYNHNSYHNDFDRKELFYRINCLYSEKIHYKELARLDIKMSLVVCEFYMYYLKADRTFSNSVVTNARLNLVTQKKMNIVDAGKQYFDGLHYKDQKVLGPSAMRIGLELRKKLPLLSKAFGINNKNSKLELPDAFMEEGFELSKPNKFDPEKER